MIESAVGPAPAHFADRIAGCLLGGAIGDAMGAGVEFLSLVEIRQRFGEHGVTGYTPAYGRECAITDDTQMTLFTLEGVIRSSVRSRARGVCHPPSVVRHAYLRWYATQRGGPLLDRPDGWLIEVPGLRSERGPGTTCLSALAAGGDGAVAHPLNDSRGCGGVMRAAPAGFPRWSAPRRFEFGCDIAALTHGHPDGYLPAGFLAAAVGALIDGAPLLAALDEAQALLALAANNAGTLNAVRAGRELGALGHPTPHSIESLGGGWVGDEALAIAIACAVGAPDFTGAIHAAVNHSGDSDSTAAIAGNLLGAAGGVAVLPAEWLAPLELRAVIEQLAADAAIELGGTPPTNEWGEPPDEWFARYPGA